MRREFFFLSVFVFFPAFQGFGAVGADILRAVVGARPTALGGLYGALGDDAFALAYNPAGIIRTSKFNLALDHQEGLAGVGVESLHFLLPTRKQGVFGFQGVFRHLPTIRNELAADDPVQAYDVVLTVANARRWNKLAVGGALKTIFSRLAEKQALTSAVDFGFLFREKLWSFAASVQHLGPKVRFEPSAGDPGDDLPLTFRFGFSRPIWFSTSGSLLGAVEGYHRRGEGWQGGLALEYWHRQFVALRGAWLTGEGEPLNHGISLGAGMHHQLGRLEYEVGYAWKPARIQSGFSLNQHYFGVMFWYGS